MGQFNHMKSYNADAQVKAIPAAGLCPCHVAFSPHAMLHIPNARRLPQELCYLQGQADLLPDIQDAERVKEQ